MDEVKKWGKKIFPHRGIDVSCERKAYHDATRLHIVDKSGSSADIGLYYIQFQVIHQSITNGKHIY